MTTPGYVLLDTTAALEQFVARIRGDPLLAVDTEAASFHRYVDRVYLVQLSTRDATAIIDPLSAGDLAPFGVLLADPEIEKIFHDADYDLRTLDRDYAFRARRLFDTRIAAQLLGEPAIGLAALLEKYQGVKVSKAYQRADWSERPLSAGMLAYAADDTRHLPALRDALRSRLQSMGRLTWAEEEFVRLERLRWSGQGGDAEDAYLRIKGAKALPPRSLAALRELVAWREAVAAQQDKATFRIIGNEPLVAVSQALPASLDALRSIRALPQTLARRYGADLIAAVARATALRDHDLPRPKRAPRFPRDPDFDQRVERLKVARNAAAQRLGLDPGVLCGKSTLEAVARDRPQDLPGLAAIDDVRQWQVEVLGRDLLSALQAPTTTP